MRGTARDIVIATGKAIARELSKAMGTKYIYIETVPPNRRGFSGSGYIINLESAETQRFFNFKDPRTPRTLIGFTVDFVTSHKEGRGDYEDLYQAVKNVFSEPDVRAEVNDRVVDIITGETTKNFPAVGLIMLEVKPNGEDIHLTSPICNVTKIEDGVAEECLSRKKLDPLAERTSGLRVNEFINKTGARMADEGETEGGGRRKHYPKNYLSKMTVGFEDEGGKEAIWRDLNAMRVARNAIIPDREWIALSKRAMDGDKDARRRQWEILDMIEDRIRDKGIYEARGDPILAKIEAALASEETQDKYKMAFSDLDALAGVMGWKKVIQETAFGRRSKKSDWKKIFRKGIRETKAHLRVAVVKHEREAPGPLGAHVWESVRRGPPILHVRFRGSARGGRPPYTFHWDFGDGGTSDEQNPEHDYTDPGTYNGVLTVTDAAGRTATRRFTKIVDEPPPPPPPPNNPPPPPPNTPPPPVQPTEKWCPVCLTWSSEKYPLHPIAGTMNMPNMLHCNRCGNKFNELTNGELILIHPYAELPERCAYCESEIHFMDKDNPLGKGKFYRLYCTNPGCRGGDGRRPWFIDLSEADFDQWMDMRKRRKLDEITALKGFLGYRPNPRTGREWRIKREIDRMEQVANRTGMHDANADRLGLTKAQLKAMNIDADELNKFDTEEKKALEEQLPKIDEEKAKESSEAMRKQVVRGVGKYTLGAGHVGNWFNKIAKHAEKSSINVGISIALLVIGVIVGSVLGWQFLVGFACWAAISMLPDPSKKHKFKLVSDFEGYRLGSITGDSDNRYITGLAVTKSFLRIASLFFFGWGFFITEITIKGLLLVAFCFIAYFILPGSYSPEEPYKFLEGLFRPVIAFMLAFLVFNTIFKSIELAWITMAFFFIFPIALEKENLARAIGRGAAGFAATFETIDKLVFLVFMVIALAVTMNWGTAAGALDIDLGTTFGNIFFPFWIIALIGGLTSPADVRPYTGIIMLTMIFIFYTSGVGDQIVGQGFFGAWWPTVHNGITAITQPLGEAMGGLRETFGQTFLLFTNPVKYARQITEGSYTKNPTGNTGAFGVEIRNLQAPAVYPGTVSMVTLYVKNEGPAKAKDVRVKMQLPTGTNIRGGTFRNVITVGPKNVTAGPYKLAGIYNSTKIRELRVMEPNIAIPFFFLINATDCKKMNQVNRKWFEDRLKVRNMYIRTNVSTEYDYVVNTWLPVTIISRQEWRERVEKGSFNPVKVPSHISTSPIKLSLASFDQPLVAGRERPFYIGFNISKLGGKKSEILWDTMNISMNFSSKLASSFTISCIPKPDKTPSSPSGTKMYEWYGKKLEKKAVFCMFGGTPDPDGPSSTYYVHANASFRFRRFETKDTLFAFSDVCFEKEHFTEPECTAIEEAVRGSIDRSKVRNISLVHAVIRRESRFYQHEPDQREYRVNPNDRNRLGLMGVTEAMANALRNTKVYKSPPSTQEGIDRHEWDDNLLGGMFYLGMQLDRFGRNQWLALAAYRCSSPDKVQEALGTTTATDTTPAWNSIKDAIRNKCDSKTVDYVEAVMGFRSDTRCRRDSRPEKSR